MNETDCPAGYHEATILIAGLALHINWKDLVARGRISARTSPQMIISASLLSVNAACYSIHYSGSYRQKLLPEMQDRLADLSLQIVNYDY